MTSDVVPATQWRVVRLLGRGGTGVGELVERPDGVLVARKRVVLHGSAEAIEGAVRRLRREAEALAALDHPAIVRLLSVEDGGDLHDVVLTMPHLAGGSLADRVALRGPLAAVEVEALAHRLLPALAAAHRAGIVHRDIAPANILFGDPDDVATAVLADFSIAATRDFTAGLTGTGRVIGTPAFMAPEQARGDGAGPPADVFALGACLFYAGTGRSPFAPPPPAPADVDPAAVLARAAAGKIAAVPTSLGAGVAALLAGLLEADPLLRAKGSSPDGAWRAHETLDVAAPARQGASPPVPQARTASRTTQSSRRAWILVGAAIAVVAVLATAALVVAPGAAPRRATGTVAPATTLAAASTCQTVLYRSACGRPVAPGATPDGSACAIGREDLDRDRRNGCEAAADAHRDGESLASGRAIEATLVPAGDIDTFTIHIEDHPQLLCDGQVTAALTAPAGAVYLVRIVRDGVALAQATSSNGEQARAVAQEPSCFGDDAGPATLEVSAPVAGARTGGAYLLSWSGSF